LVFAGILFRIHAFHDENDEENCDYGTK
jgi:hypothetical protein